MGFIDSATTVTIRARLTDIGRERLLTNSNTIFSHFVLGDSDANYNTSENLTTGRVPTNSGNLGANSLTNDNIYQNVGVGSKLFLTVPPTTKKSVEINSSKINSEIKLVGENTVSGESLSYLQIDKTITNNQNTNYFKSLSLPIKKVDVNVFTGTTSQNGGWSDTPFSGLGVSKVLMGVIDNDKYGEIIDGKSVKLSIPVFTGFTSGGTGTGITTYNIYSTFPNTTIPKTDLDSVYIDRSSYPKSLFKRTINVSYLVSDEIQKPNNDTNKSWSTGYDTFKPFSLNRKELVNVQGVPSTGINADKIAGVIYLDKGIFAITDQTIVENVAINFSGDVETTTTNNGLGLYYYTGGSYNCVVDSIQKDLVQNIVCIAARGEFYNSQNETLNISDDVRISEVAITDVSGTVLAIGKTDRHIVKKKNDFVVFDVQIVI
ncbi:hypothetical protein N9F18_00215 [bacterium]|jgi:hypothetical protein|nr:hypothetical protein [bacterium]